MVKSSKPRNLVITQLRSTLNTSFNRDDTGMSKTAEINGVLRGRYSSQCEKFSLRQSIQGCDIQTRHAFVKIAEDLKALGKFDENDIDTFCKSAKDRIESSKSTSSENGKTTEDVATVEDVESKSAESEPKKDKKAKNGSQGSSKKKPAKDELLTQVIRISPAEIEYIKGFLVDCLERNNIDDAGKIDLSKAPNNALCPSAAAAMFGRFSTFAQLKNVDSAMSVAHFISVHKHNTLHDFFIATDDLTRNGTFENSGAAHLGSSEHCSNTYVGTIVIDLEQYCYNWFNKSCDKVLADPAEKEKRVESVSVLFEAIVKVTPSGKKTSAFGNQNASFALLEFVGHPLSRTNYFDKALPLDDNIMSNAYDRIRERLLDEDEAFGKKDVYARAYYALGMSQDQHKSYQTDLGCEKITVPAIKQWLNDILK